MPRAPRLPQGGPSLLDAGDALAGTVPGGVEPSDGASGAASATGTRRLVVEADGGSRGNPGPAAYGALVRDADSGEVLASEGLTLGVTTNNVAEYSGLVA